MILLCTLTAASVSIVSVVVVAVVVVDSFLAEGNLCVFTSSPQKNNKKNIYNFIYTGCPTQQSLSL